MKNIIRKALLLVLLLTCINGVVSAADFTMSVGFIVPSLQQEFFINLAEGTKSKLNDKGYEVQVASFNNDVSEAISIIENYIIQDVDVIIASLQDRSCDYALKRAMDQGIKVFLAGIRGEYFDLCLLADNKNVGDKIGEMAADFINEKLNGEANVVAFTQTQNVDMADRSKSMKESLIKNVPNANIVGEAEFLNVGDAAAAMENFLQKNPNIKVVISYNDSAALEALEVVKAAGKADENFGIYGCDATNQGLKRIKEGSAFRGTVYMGNLVEEIAGKTIRLLEGDPTLDEISYSENIKITQESVDQFLE